MSTRSPEESAGAEILALVEEQVALGPRVPGTEPHELLADMLGKRLRHNGAVLVQQEFSVPFRGSLLSCRNIVGIFRAAGPGSGRAAAAADLPLLLGTHYDTRIQADRDPDPALRQRPIPGANDGGSGTAVLLHMLPWLARQRLARDVVIAFFDAEDLGNIDGKEFSIGAGHLAAHPVAGCVPSEVIVLDMVGGTDMVFDIDANSLASEGSRRLTGELFRLGASRGWEPFTRDKPDRVKHIISDHYPFACRGTAASILIDIDYPQWHTQSDMPAALSGASLGVSEAALSLFLSRWTG